MTATNHAVTGMLVAAAIKRPELALPAAFLSHFVLDEIPHWSHEFKKQQYTKLSVAADLALALALTLLAALTLNRSAVLILAASGLGVLPDAMWITEFNGPKLVHERNKNKWNKFRWFFHKIQWSETTKGFYVEAVWLILTLTLLFKNFSR